MGDHDDHVERVRAVLDQDDDERWKMGQWMSHLLPNVKVIAADAATPARVTLAFTCLEEHCNRLGNLHGGAAASLFDVCTTLPLVLIGRPGYWQFLGVTRNLNVSYFRPVPAGEEVIIETEAVQVGKRLCTLKGVMRRKRDGEIMSTCEHLKANIDPVSSLYYASKVEIETDSRRDWANSHGRCTRCSGDICFIKHVR